MDIYARPKRTSHDHCLASTSAIFGFYCLLAKGGAGEATCRRDQDPQTPTHRPQQTSYNHCLASTSPRVFVSGYLLLELLGLRGGQTTGTFPSSPQLLFPCASGSLFILVNTGKKISYFSSLLTFLNQNNCNRKLLSNNGNV